MIIVKAAEQRWRRCQSCHAQISVKEITMGIEEPGIGIKHGATFVLCRPCRNDLVRMIKESDEDTRDKV